MALQASGAIALADVNTELGLSSGATVSLNDSVVRTLFGLASGQISLGDGYGKANRKALSYVFSANTTQTTISTSSLVGYVAGKTDLTITVNSGVYVYSTSTATPALSITNATTGDTIRLVNNGIIMGARGAGGSGSTSTGNAGGSGGAAISLGYSISLTNNGTIAGGGGGGGQGGGYTYFDSNTFTTYRANGGAGGTGAGGLGSGNTGGSAGGSTPYGSAAGGGSGGSLGSAGSNGGNISWAGGAGGAGGKGINLNGYSLTYLTTGTINGAVS